MKVIFYFEKLVLYNKFKGDNFRVDAYMRAIGIVGNDVLWQKIMKKEKVEGIGKGLSEKIREIVRTGKLVEFDSSHNHSLAYCSF